MYESQIVGSRQETLEEMNCKGLMLNFMFVIT
jgi:hypothetical protein